MFDCGVSRNVYCVNVDAVIAALLLKMLWGPLQAGEIDDHLNRGRNMDTRTPARPHRNAVSWPEAEADDAASGGCYSS